MDCKAVALSRVRGLKPDGDKDLRLGAGRTLTSAWIETGKLICNDCKFQVALSRVRGLKL